MDPVIPEASDEVRAPAPPSPQATEGVAQKYIRTYAGDIATVERGGVPNLAPLTVPAPTPTPQPPPAAPLAPSEPAAGALPTLDQGAPVTVAPASPLETPPDALITTYEQGMREATTRTGATPAPAAPTTLQWPVDEQERSAALERLRTRSRTSSLLTSTPSQSPPPYVIHEDIVVPSEPAPLPPPPPPPVMPVGPPPPPEPIPPPQQPIAPLPPPPERPPAAPPSGLHTYRDDFTDRVQATQASRASIIAGEQDARRGGVATPAAPRDKRYIYAGIALFLVGAGGMYFAYARFVAHTGPVVLAPAASAPIFVDDREIVSGTGSTLLLAFEQSVGRPLPEGEMRLVYDPNATTSNASIFNNLGLPAPGILLRNIDAARSMAGVVSSSGVQSPFFILSVTSYGDTFAGMLSWEPTILRSLKGLFSPYPPVMASTATSTATSTLARTTSAPPADQGFVDQVVANHDARIYRDGEGRSLLIYGYWDQGTLVIARDEAAFAALIERLAASRTR